MERWDNEEVENLKALYKQNNVPSDQIIKDKDALGIFAESFNAKFHYNRSDKEVADQLLKLRKKGVLPRVR